jgi:hypothetical protein
MYPNRDITMDTMKDIMKENPFEIECRNHIAKETVNSIRAYLNHEDTRTFVLNEVYTVLLSLLDPTRMIDKGIYVHGDSSDHVINIIKSLVPASVISDLSMYEFEHIFTHIGKNFNMAVKPLEGKKLVIVGDTRNITTHFLVEDGLHTILRHDPFVYRNIYESKQVSFICNALLIVKGHKPMEEVFSKSVCNSFIHLKCL